MPRISKSEVPVSVDLPEIEGRYTGLGDYTVGFETHKADLDPAPVFRGLPGDRCQCPHWGVVLTGRITFRYDGYDEEYRAGDAYLATPGHLPLFTAGTELIEFSPAAELARTMSVVEANLAAQGAGD